MIKEVERPDHYTDGGIETIDFIAAKLTEEELFGYVVGNVFKYLSRAGKKDPAKFKEDVAKAEWYLHYFRTRKKILDEP